MFAMPLAEELLFEGCRPSAGVASSTPVCQGSAALRCRALGRGDVVLLSGACFPCEDGLRAGFLHLQTNGGRPS